MKHTLTAIGLALALVGSAHAQDAQETQITVRLNGQPQRELLKEIYHAAEQVCVGQPASDLDSECVEATYGQALRQLRAKPQAERAAYAQTSTVRPQ